VFAGKRQQSIQLNQQQKRKMSINVDFKMYRLNQMSQQQFLQKWIPWSLSQPQLDG